MAKSKPPPKAALRADCTPEMDKQIEDAVAILCLRGERTDKSKFIRDAVEKRLQELAPIIERAQQAVRTPPKK